MKTGPGDDRQVIGYRGLPITDDRIYGAPLDLAVRLNLSVLAAERSKPATLTSLLLALQTSGMSLPLSALDRVGEALESGDGLQRDRALSTRKYS